MPPRETTREQLPIFKDYTISYLADKLKYEESYLVELKSGRHIIRRRFINTCVLGLRKTEEDLFGAPNEPTPNA